MESLWIIYWIGIFASFVFACYNIIKKRIISGTLHALFTIAFTALSVFIGVNSGYSGKGQDEFTYFVNRLFSLKLDSVLLVVLFVFVLGFNIYHIAVFYEHANA